MGLWIFYFKLNPSLFYNIIDISTKHTQCQIILRNKLKNSKCCDIRSVHNDTSKDTNIQYDRYLSAKEALKEIRKDKIGNMVTNFTSQSFVIKAMWEEAFAENVKHWQSTIIVYRKIFTILLRDTSTTLYRPSKTCPCGKKQRTVCAVPV